MAISIFTTMYYPNERGDNWQNAIDCYKELADQVVVIHGDKLVDMQFRHFFMGVDFMFHEWPKEFSWPFFGEQFQRGYDSCDGDWVIKADLDYIFHENDFENIRKALKRHSDAPALSFWKYQFILPDRYNIKSRLAIAVNKAKFGDRIRFDSGGDLCQVSLHGEYLSPDKIPEAKIPFYNYEKLLKTKEQIAADQGRMERAWHRHFGYYQMGSDGTDESAYQKWLEAQIGKFNKPQEHISLESHPKYVQETIRNLTPEQWGYDGFGHLERNDYVKGR